MKKFYTYLLIAAIVLTVFPAIFVYADGAEAEPEKEQNFEYVIPMNNSSVSIHYEAGIIIAVYRSTELLENAPWITTDTYGVFDLNGKIIVDYGVYDYIDYSDSGYIRAKKDGEVFLLDTSGKKIKLADGEKFTDITVMAENWYCIEGGDYFKLKNDKMKREIKIQKKSVLISGKEDSVSAVTQLTDDFIVFNTKLSTVVFSNEGKLIYNFEKIKYRSSEEIDYSFDNPTMALRFEGKGYAGYKDERRLCGLVDISGNVITKPVYQNLVIAGEDIRIQKNGKWGVIDINGNIIVDFRYDGAERIAEDIFALKNNGKTQLVNLKYPDMFKDIEFDSVEIIFYNFGRIAIKKGGKYGLISFDGELIAAPEYDYMDYDYNSDDGMIKVRIKELYGFIDMDGNVKVPVIYYETAVFSEGLCGVVYRERGKEEYSAFVNKNGEEVLRLDKDVWVFYNSVFSEGLCAVRRGTEENWAEMFGKCEYIDKAGKTVISGGDWANDGGRFKNGLAEVTSKMSGAMNPGSGFYGTDGVIRYTGGSLETPVAGNTSVTADTSQYWKYVVPYCKYDHCEILSNGLIKIGTRIDWDYWAGDNAPPDPVLLYGLLDHEGKPLTEIIYNSIGTPNADGYMLATVKNGGKNKYVLFDDKGKILPTSENAVVTLFSRSYSVETDDALTLYVNKKSYKVAKSVLAKAGIRFDGEEETAVQKVSAVYGNGFVISSEYSDRTAFVLNWDGTLRYKTDQYISSTPDGLILMNEYANYKLVDFDGKEIIPAAYGRQIYALCDSTTYEYIHGFYIYKTGLFDWSIRDINNPKAFGGMKFTGGIVYCDIKSKTIHLSNDDQTHGLYGFDGTEILPFEYADIGKISEGLVWFQTTGNKFGFANLKGEIVFESSEYTLWREFSEGLAGYTKVGGCGFMNHDFEPVIELGEDWEIRSGFQNGVAAVAYKGEIMFINREGKVVIAQGQDSKQAPWAYTQGFTGGLAAVAAHEPYAVQHNGPIMHDQDGIIMYSGNIPSGWAAGEVTEAVELGIVPEKMRDLYKEKITRKEFAYIAVKYLELKKVKYDSLYKENIFKDTNDRSVNIAYALGIVNGYEDGTFKSDGSITRQEAAAMLARTYRIYASAPDAGYSGSDYADKNKIAAWAAESVAMMNSLGIMKGEEGNQFNPNGGYTREQSYITFLRMFKAAK